jgi:hypothetical protein
MKSVNNDRVFASKILKKIRNSSVKKISQIEEGISKQISGLERSLESKIYGVKFSLMKLFIASALIQIVTQFAFSIWGLF